MGVRARLNRFAWTFCLLGAFPFGALTAVVSPRFIISQQVGDHFLRGVPGLVTLGNGQALPVGASVFVRKDARLEGVTTSGELLRFGQMTNFALKKPGELYLWKGAALLSLPDKAPSFAIQSPLASMKVVGPGAIMMGVTESGGFKVIGLHGQVKLLISESAPQTILPGELLFIYTGSRDFSRKVNIELSTLMQTATLIRDFEKPLPFLKDIVTSSKRQNRRIKNRFRVLVGDAKTDKEFQLMIIEEEKME